MSSNDSNDPATPPLSQIAITLLNDVCVRAGVSAKRVRPLSIVFTDSGEVWTLLTGASAFAVVDEAKRPAEQLRTTPTGLLQILYGTFDAQTTPIALDGDAAVVDGFVQALTAGKNPLTVRF